MDCGPELIFFANKPARTAADINAIIIFIACKKKIIFLLPKILNCCLLGKVPDNLNVQTTDKSLQKPSQA